MSRRTSTAPRALAIIPARGGSKGLPRKNVLDLDGRPLIAHTLEQARFAHAIERVVVSTDDPEIREVSRGCGAEVIDRPAELATDEASSESALIHVLDVLEETEGYRPELVVFLQCTSPIRRRDDIDRAVEQLRRSGADSLLSAVPFHGFTWHRGAAGAEALNYDYRQRPRRQESQGRYLENGSIYVFKTWILRQTGHRLGGRISLYAMDKASGIDIDTAEDLELCRAVLQSRC